MDPYYYRTEIHPEGLSEHTTPSSHYLTNPRTLPQIFLTNSRVSPEFQDRSNSNEVKGGSTTSSRYEPYPKHSSNSYPSCVATESPQKVEVKINEPSFYRDYCNKRHDYQSPEIDSQLHSAIQSILTEFESKKTFTTTDTSSTAKRKRASSEQLRILKQVFEYTFFPSTELRNELARVLEMTPRAVQVWFQNRRQSWKSSKGKGSNGKESHSPCSSPPKGLSPARFDSPALSPPILNEAHSTGYLSMKSAVVQVPMDRFCAPTLDSASVSRLSSSQYSSPNNIDFKASQRESTVESLAPFGMLNSGSYQQISETTRIPYGHSGKLPSLLEMGIDSRSSTLKPLPYNHNHRIHTSAIPEKRNSNFSEDGNHQMPHTSIIPSHYSLTKNH